MNHLMKSVLRPVIRQNLACISSTTSSSTTNENTKRMFDMVKNIKFGMLTTIEDDNSLRSRPMASKQADQFDGTLWFFTNKSSHKVDEMKKNIGRVNVSYSDISKQNYVSLSGRADIIEDKNKMKSLWTPYLKAFFPKGLDDDDLALLKITVDYAEYWDGPSNKMTQAYGMIKAYVTGDASSMGENKKVNVQ
ncbi:unnamed protein product [Didymodactylos carnosus]|uniref:General stress protein FMN-binding split barrel domain-containing protein n=1 Tax=Didymodactylos carnosus TaxID=1234261 RepID=A0A814IHM3_9BILA|nr:unnamed protein product [Didymodactylos carnosus]CAF1023601.1 unnamed protein product [Didymodactylos carnosus]CAF3750965.1 unnamed protein product [Didymodactylos carnosus]CAF3794880.1 unnamed protein product [Didymodactylos carnosus]